MFKRFPDTIATFSFIPTGLCFGHLFFLPWIHESLYDEFHVWPFFTFLFAIVVTSSIISIIKLSNGKYIFEHFVYLLTASLLFIIAGILFVVFTIEYTSIALFINAIASGIVTITGLSYVNIRTVKHERPLRIAICHMWKLFGFAATYTIFLFLFYDLDDNSLQHTSYDDKLREFYQIFGFSLIGTTTFFLLLLAINELLQRQGIIYNYRDCLDHDNSIANNYCKLFSHNEVIIERNTTVLRTGMWKSAENLLPQHKNKLFTTLWTLYMLIPKLHGAILFHYFLLTMSMNTASLADFGISYTHGITLWLMIIEAFIGCIMLRFVHCKKVYVTTAVGAVLAIGVSMIFYGQWPPTGIAICLWVFYAAVAISISIPDIALLEMSKIRYNEGVLAIGYFVEIIPIAAIQLSHRNAHTLTQLLWYTDKYFIAYAIAAIVILIVASSIYILHMPNTFEKSLLQIQNELLKHKGYFTFVNNSDERKNDFIQVYPSQDNNNIADAQSVDAFASRDQTTSTTSYAQMSDQLPPVNNAKNLYNLYDDLPKTKTIIPRANIVRTPTIGSKK